MPLREASLLHRLRALAPVLVLAVCSCGHALAEQRTLSQDWLSRKGDAAGAEQPAFPDGGWQRIAVPHDYSIMDRPDRTPPFDPKTAGGQDSGYLPGGQGWYRKHLALSGADARRVLRLHFEAVYMDAEIWFNGERVGRHRYGYTPFTFDLTGKARGGDNVIVVRVNHVDPSSRWYAGSGLIRPVTLELLDPVHLAPDSVFASTRTASPKKAELDVRATVVNRRPAPARAELVSTLFGADGSVVARERRRLTIAAQGRADMGASLGVDQPKLWSPEAPNLYTLEQEVRVEGQARDVRRTRVGIRTVTVDAQHGLRINGKRTLLRGGNVHHDHYMLGAAGWPDAEARKVALLKAAGYNAIRIAHNPASQAMMDAADELGMLVIDEAFDMWRKPKRDADYARFFDESWEQDIDGLVLGGRNHPSVLLWSIGNEIPEQGSPAGVRTARELVARIRKLDPTRPVTQGVNIDSPGNAAQFAEVDVAGYNYRAHLFAKDHATHPQRVMYTSESTSKDAFRYWEPVETVPWVIGDFVWTAIDYIGESGIGWMGYSHDWKQLGPYPWHLAYCGEIDATGRKRPAAYYRQVLWKTGIDPVAAFVEQPPGTADLPDRDLFKQHPELDWSLHDLHPSWTWNGQEGKPLKVVVYSEHPEVELFLNGVSLGRRRAGRETEYKAEYSVHYQPGRLLAVGYSGGKAAGQWELNTAGAPARVKLHADRRQVRANGQDLVYVTAELADRDGRPVYAQDGDRKFRVSVKGAGTLAGVGNGHPMDASSFQLGERSTFHGRLVAVVRAGLQAGPIEIEFAADGIPVQRVQVDAVAQ
ncbi:glycoside hydrolase family 2 TIM barrel-domain containing protein [Massilia niabensis]|uniref:Glycoside hydrolase family 2 TIM barrel-domain containing protein n=1 Tax=Massilia niabensis TaxID=544910 RepID=A0ABW0L0Q2_9BURK